MPPSQLNIAFEHNCDWKIYFSTLNFEIHILKNVLTLYIYIYINYVENTSNMIVQPSLLMFFQACRHCCSRLLSVNSRKHVTTWGFINLPLKHFLTQMCSLNIYMYHNWFIFFCYKRLFCFLSSKVIVSASPPVSQHARRINLSIQ